MAKFYKGQVPWNKGLISREIQVKNCLQCGREIKRPPWCSSKNWNKREFCSNQCRGKNLLNKELSEETKKKMSNARIGYEPWNKGIKTGITYWLGKKRSDEDRMKMRIAKLGEKSPFWKGGISNDPYPEDWCELLKDSIRKRDNYVCQECGIHQDELDGWFKKLHIHHIDYDKNNLNPYNLISLCNKCHMKTNYNREYWIKYFNDNKII